MIRGGFLSAELIALARDGSAASRVTRRANAVVLLDDGWSCQEVADALLLNDDTIRNWHKLFEQRGIEGLRPSRCWKRSKRSIQQWITRSRPTCDRHRASPTGTVAAPSRAHPRRPHERAAGPAHGHRQLNRRRRQHQGRAAARGA
jgi:Homeodomain-like domain